MSTPSDSPPATPTMPFRKRLKKLSRWALINGLFATAIYYALIEGSKGAGNLCLAFTWFSLLINGIVFLGLCLRNHSPTDPFASLREGRTLPAIISHGVGLAYIVVFFWHGWWFSAIAWVFNEIIEAAAYSAAKEPHQPPAVREAPVSRARRRASGELDNSELFEQLRREVGRRERLPSPAARRRASERSQPITPPSEPRDTTPRIELD